MSYFEKVIHSVSRVLDIIARYFLLGMMSLVVINVISRRLDFPILGTYDLVGLMLIVTAAFALAYCAVGKGHIFVGFILDRFSPRVQSIFDVVTGILAVAFFGIVTWQSAIYARMIWQTGQVTPTIHMTFYPVLYMMAAGFLLLFFVLVIDLINSLMKVVRK